MTLLLILFIAGGLYGWITYKPPEKKKAPANPHPVVTVEYCRRQEQERKQAARKAQARRDIETAQATLNDLDLLMDAAQRRYYGASKDKDVEKAQRQIITLRKQIAAQVEKIEKAKYILRYGG